MPYFANLAKLCSTLVILTCSLTAQPDNWALIRAKTEAALQQVVSGSPGIIGLVVEDLGDSDRFAVNENVVFPQGSAIKIPILIEVYLQAQEKRFTLTDQLPVTAADQVGGSGILNIFGNATSRLSIADLAELMIFLSDNSATNMLIKQIGMKQTNRRFADMGLADIRLQRLMMDTAARGRGEENLATPASAAKLMRMLYQGEIGNKTVSAQMMKILRRPKSGALKAGLPNDVPVAFKPGGIPGVATEWAVVELPERPFVIVFMGNFGLESGFDREMKQVATLAYDYFKRKGTSTRYGTYVDPALIDKGTR